MGIARVWQRPAVLQGPVPDAEIENRIGRLVWPKVETLSKCLIAQRRLARLRPAVKALGEACERTV